ncbi:MAG: rhomboid family intramembrane serine protease [bacterium]|nr:rhomboid family intramembrane serine protease [bacterium]
MFNPRKRFPSLLLAIIAVNFGVFGLQRSMPANMVEPFIHMFGKVPEQALTLAGCYQLITAGFLHADWWHLIGNMYILWIFGDNVIDVLYDHGERKGPLMFLFFYTVVLIISGITACMVYFEFKVIIGASGAISGVMAAYWRLFPRSRLYQVFFPLFYPFKIPMWFYLGIWFLMNLGFMKLGSNISWPSHFAGFAAGFLLIPYFLPFRLEEIRKRKYLAG